MPAAGASWLIAASDKRIVNIAAAPTTQGGNLGLSHSIEVDTPPTIENHSTSGADSHMEIDFTRTAEVISTCPGGWP